MYNNIITKTNCFTRLLKKLVAIPVRNRWLGKRYKIFEKP